MEGRVPSLCSSFFSLSIKLSIKSGWREEAQRLPGRFPQWQQLYICLCQLYPLSLHQDTARAPQGAAGEMLVVPEQCRACPWVLSTRKGLEEAKWGNPGKFQSFQGHSRAHREAGGAAKPKAQLRVGVWVFNPADINAPGLQFRETS